ncbi:unnamed protein product, partial [Onchocerca ochengi]|uniref:GST N-terminal domain-containing protein n=1 Tax=Onchocerca ochengi TaxID=42157 RepID=A0A182EZG5_ONCOC
VYEDDRIVNPSALVIFRHLAANFKLETFILQISKLASFLSEKCTLSSRAVNQFKADSHKDSDEMAGGVNKRRLIQRCVFTELMKLVNPEVKPFQPCR